MKATFEVEINQFVKACAVSIEKASRGTRKGTTQACKEILEESNKRVPVGTGTLLMSGFYEVIGYRRDFTGIVGYGGNGDPYNERSHRRASEYAVKVHEDLDASHPNGGEAKFLENAVREYGDRNFLRIVTENIKTELEG